tara:strand:+ start:236 stop:388 length:153 start_codon:yes stop_codon:yes gene_type:complete
MDLVDSVVLEVEYLLLFLELLDNLLEAFIIFQVVVAVVLLVLVQLLEQVD